MTPTRLRVLAGLAALGCLGLLAFVLLLEPVLPVLPWAQPAGLAIVALGVLAAALSFRRRLHGEPGARPYDPLHAARMVVLAKACSHAGALLAGGYVGLAIALVLRSADGARTRDVVLAALSAAAALALVGVGLLLERFCRIEQPPDDDPSQPTRLNDYR